MKKNKSYLLLKLNKKNIEFIYFLRFALVLNRKREKKLNKTDQ